MLLVCRLSGHTEGTGDLRPGLRLVACRTDQNRLDLLAFITEPGQGREICDGISGEEAFKQRESSTWDHLSILVDTLEGYRLFSQI